MIIFKLIADVTVATLMSREGVIGMDKEKFTIEGEEEVLKMVKEIVSKIREATVIANLAADCWIPKAGNAITIRKYNFCATPQGNKFKSAIIFSEVTSGARLTEIELDFFDAIVLDEKSRYLEFLKEQSKSIANRLKEYDDLDEEILRKEYIAISKLGPKPPTRDIEEWIV